MRPALIALVSFAAGCKPDASTVLTLDFSLPAGAAGADRLRVTLTADEPFPMREMSGGDRIVVTVEGGALVLAIAAPEAEESVSLEIAASRDLDLAVAAEALRGEDGVAAGQATARVVVGEWWRAAVELVCIGDCVPDDAGFDMGTPDAPPEIPTINLGSTPADLAASGSRAGEGAYVVAAGDIDDDGEVDLILGAPESDGPATAPRGDAGAVYVIRRGKVGAGDAIDLGDDSCDCFLTIYGAEAGDRLGTAVAVGNVDDDAYDDIVVAAPGADGPLEDRAEAGEVYVLRGRDFSASGVEDTYDFADGDWDMRIVGRGSLDAALGDRLGTSLDTGRLDSGSTDDLVIGAPGSAGPAGDRPGAGAAYAWLGRDPLPASVDLAAGEYDVLLAGAAGAALGTAVAAPNVNDDPYEDVVAGAPGGDGALVVLLGQAAFPSSLIDAAESQNEWTVVGPGAGTSFGWALAQGTLDAEDGDDVVVGAPTATGLMPGDSCAGAVFAVSGRADLLPGELNVEETVGAAVARGGGCDGLGFTVATGDIDGDDIDDVLAGAPRGAGDRGEVIVIAGGGAALRVLGAAAGDGLGWGLCVEDIAGGVAEDIVLGAPGFDDPGPPAREDAGRVYLLLDPLTQ